MARKHRRQGDPESERLGEERIKELTRDLDRQHRKRPDKATTHNRTRTRRNEQ
jgi:hypothetical protein